MKFNSGKSSFFIIAVAVAIHFHNRAFVQGGVLAAGGTYWSCMGACCSGSAAGGLMASIMTFGAAGAFGAAACAAVCSSLSAGQAVVIPGLCFADDVQVLRLTTHGVVSGSVKDVRRGERVATLDFDGKIQWTKVLSNRRKIASTENISFVSIGAVAVNNKSFNLSVTNNHFMVRAANNANKLQLREELVEAQDLQVGDRIFVYGGSEQKEIATVKSIAASKKKYKNLFATEAGTVLANGVLTSAMCDATDNALPWALRQNASAAIDMWKYAHRQGVF